MRILIAEDDPVPRTVLERTLSKWGHEVVSTGDGAEAWQVLQQEDAPKLAILDWIMPGMDGPDVCRKVRDLVRQEPAYIILLTSKQQKQDVVVGLDSGADDYVIKPFDQQELKSRIRVGERMLALQQKLADRVRKLEEALAQVTELRGLLPICSYCRKIRDDKNYWHEVETYLSVHTDVHFSHGICPSCWSNVVEPELAKAGIPSKPADIPT
jgi:sigma-B regulation protein RsbU (phosphoserine phosphatase)